MLRLSIIIPFYNVEAYIAQCLDSVFNQDIPEDEYEVICVNDASPDHSREIVLEYQKKHKNLVLIEHEVNKKLGAARNTGLKHAQGKYIWFVDSDDWVKMNCLQKVITIMEMYQLEVLHMDYYINHTLRNKVPIVENTIMTGADMFFTHSVRWSDEFIVIWRHIYQRSFLIDNNIWFAENIMCEDNDYAFLVYMQTQRVMHISYPAYVYRINQSSFGGQNKREPSLFYYWIDCAYRLMRIYSCFLHIVDPRFISALKTFIRFFLNESITLFYTFDIPQRKICAQIMEQYSWNTMKHWMSKKAYWHFWFELVWYKWLR